MYPRREPYVWVTWLTGLLSGENHCWWAAWIKAHYGDVAKRPPDVDLTVWKTEHAAMVSDKYRQLRRDGWDLYVEDQNKFQLKGRAGTLGGVPDIVAIKDDVAKVIDCKTGKPREKDILQVLIYMLVLPLTHTACAGQQLVGELHYPSQLVVVPAERLDAQVKGMIRAAIESVCGSVQLQKVPSASECKFCDIDERDCPERVQDTETTPTATDMF